jgi:hypothetical protein
MGLRFGRQAGAVVAHLQPGHAAVAARVDSTQRRRLAAIASSALPIRLTMTCSSRLASHRRHSGCSESASRCAHGWRAGAVRAARRRCRRPGRGRPAATGRSTCGRRLELAGDLPHAVDQLGDAFEVGAPSPRRRVRESGGVARQRAQGGQRLVEFVRDAGRELADDGELAGLDQFVLRRAQRALGADALGDFVLQLLVGRREVGGAFSTLRSSSSCAFCSASRAARRSLRWRRRSQTIIARMQSSSVETRRRRRGSGLISSTVRVREHGQRPRRAGQRLRLGRGRARRPVDRDGFLRIAATRTSRAPCRAARRFRARRAAAGRAGCTAACGRRRCACSRRAGAGW